ncbi:hypothetical protein NZK35_01055 [Stieleria sp. ICT_E10.1]|uniref:hypothetical protein n=1 Tax=Stieleria sedimenti TaxID=2976331 RepID=UPI00218047E9|nr:hypothetical protein [Stieleria sedimenti]MCS7465257.1 hypothetical protein [Stieleria sedimenti]
MSDEPATPKSQAAHYFAELEARIVQRLHAEAGSEASRAALVRSTGVEDAKLIEELSKLGITADELICLRFIPLVLVAWAEDHADSEEREVIQTQAAKLGIREDSTAWLVLETWLQKQPPGLGIDAWKRYTHGILKKMSRNAANRLIHLTEKQMITVAKASGGHLGVGKVSHKESTMINRLLTIMHEQAERA